MSNILIAAAARRVCPHGSLLEAMDLQPSVTLVRSTRPVRQLCPTDAIVLSVAHAESRSRRDERPPRDTSASPPCR